MSTPHPDVVVVGGGPAGLATALAVRRHGLSVLVVDRQEPGQDKACGEGLMPDALTALRGLGVELGAVDGMRFRGIRFVGDGAVAEGNFPDCHGLGVRRTRLHARLVAQAESAGVQLRWRSHVEGIDGSGVRLRGGHIGCRFVVGADGAHSRIRWQAGLGAAWTGPRRMGLRQHYRCRPWTDLVEVHWAPHAQAYVTPVGPEEVGVALVSQAPGPRFEDMPHLFPVLVARLAGAEPKGNLRGGLSMSTRLRAVTKGRVALVGDASGAVDAVTGEGLALAFHQAEALGAALASGDLASYGRRHRQIQRMPLLMARGLLLLDAHTGFRRRVLHALAARPQGFDRLLGLHVGAHRPAEVSADVLGLAWQMVAPR